MLGAVTEDERFQSQLDEISGRALKVGGLVAGVLALGSGLATGMSGLLLTHSWGAAPPAAFATVSGLYSFAIRGLALRNRHGSVGALAVFSFLLLVTIFFVVAEVAAPYHAAQY